MVWLAAVSRTSSRNGASVSPAYPALCHSLTLASRAQVLSVGIAVIWKIHAIAECSKLFLRPLVYDHQMHGTIEVVIPAPRGLIRGGVAADRHDPLRRLTGFVENARLSDDPAPNIWYSRCGPTGHFGQRLNADIC